MAQKAKYEELEKFKQTLEILRTRYTIREIAKELGTDAANLSSYISGNKTPGVITLQKFNARFEEEIRLLSENLDTVEESAFTYSSPKKQPKKKAPQKAKVAKPGKTDILSSLEKLVAANMSMASSMEKLSQSNLILAETNRSLLIKTSSTTRKQKISKR